MYLERAEGHERGEEGTVGQIHVDMTRQNFS